MDPVDIYEVLEDPSHPVFPDVGRLLFSLVVSQPSWIFRRVDTSMFVKERHFRRHMSVDCRVPPEVVSYAEELGLDRFVVPLRFVMRQSLLAFDLRLHNLPVPLLNREQNIMATRALLQAAVEENGIEPDEEIQTVMARVASADSHVAEEASKLLGVGVAGGAARTLEEDLLHWAITTFDRNYLLLADVPLDTVRERTVFKITQELTYPPGPMRLTRAQLRTRIGWDPVSLLFDAPDLTTTASYHFQFIPPDGLAISDGALLAGGTDAEPVVFGTKASRSSVLGLNIHAEEVPPAESYRALVQVRPSPDGLLRASAASAALSTLLLLLAAAVAGRVNVDSQIGPSSALLLVIPGAVSTFLARPGEHSLAAHALRGVRALTLTSAITTYVAAAMLVVGMTDSALRSAWLLLGAISVVPTVALAVAVRRCGLSMRHGTL